MVGEGKKTHAFRDTPAGSRTGKTSQAERQGERLHSNGREHTAQGK